MGTITPNEMSFPKSMSTVNVSDISASKDEYTATSGLDAAYQWASDDFSSLSWVPQGVGGLFDDDQAYMLITWYSKSQKGTRISFVQVGSGSGRKYVHVLLIDSQGTPLDLHAGGCFEYDNLIYVADTGIGLRVFDVRQILTTYGGIDFGQYGCKYGLKEVNTINLLQKIRQHEPSGDIVFSWCDMSRSYDFVITGSYASGGVGYEKRLRYFALFDIKQNFAVNSVVSNGKGSDPPGSGIPNYVQGMTIDNNSGNPLVFASRSTSNASLRALQNVNGSWQVLKTWKWPYGTEDVHISGSGNLWGCTEHRHLRYLFRGKVSTYIGDL